MGGGRSHCSGRREGDILVPILCKDAGGRFHYSGYVHGCGLFIHWVTFLSEGGVIVLLKAV
jgi:hypothetical protein